MHEGEFSCPPPFDLSPTFPIVRFDADDVPHLDGPDEEVRSVVAQIVPTACNRYARRFGFAVDWGWKSFAEVKREFYKWVGDRGEVAVHHRRPGTRVVGSGSGMPRFLVRGRSAIFVAQEMGPFPEDIEVDGFLLKGYVAVVGCDVPCSKGTQMIYHLVPAEFLSDPILPGAPPASLINDLARLLPPPPLFRVGKPCYPGSPFYQAIVVVGLSQQERIEGGGITADGTTVVRGGMYSILIGDVRDCPYDSDQEEDAVSDV